MVYIITGTSSGIGKAIANYYLAQNISVIGIARKNTISHPLFHFISCDLSQQEEIKKLSFDKIITPKDYPVRLINNAGTIGAINRLQSLSFDHYFNLALLNLVVPQYLTSLVVKTFGFENTDVVINISSGAAERPTPSWAAYCASKAGLNMFGETIHQEMRELGKTTKVFNIAPGVVDTPMQSHIRNSNSEDFSAHQKFADLKTENKLRTPQEIAFLLDDFLKNMPQENETVTFRL